jgi:hypothetical protein
MKQTVSSVRAIFLPVLILLVALITSCTKDKVDPPKHQDPPKPDPLAVIVSISATPSDSKRGDTSFYNEVNRTFAMSAQNSPSFGIAGETGTSIMIPTVNALVKIDWWANNSAGTRTTGSKTFPIYSKNKTGLVGGAQGVKWHSSSNRTTIVSDSLVDPAANAIWENSPTSPLDRRFYTDGTGSAYGGPVSPSYFVYTLIEGDNWINFQQVPQKIVQVTATTMVLKWWQKDPISPTTIWYLHESYYIAL